MEPLRLILLIQLYLILVHEELEVKQHVLKRSETSILLCDSSKYQKHSTFTFAQCQEFDVMITDAISEKDAAVVKGIANIIVAE